MMAQLEKAIARYFSPLQDRLGLVLVDQQAYGMGALKVYEAASLRVRVINDRGIIGFEVAPVCAPDKYFDVALYEEYLNPPKQGVLNLSLQQQADFLDSHWEWLNDALSETNTRATLKEIERTARRRSERLLGRKVSRDLTS